MPLPTFLIVGAQKCGTTSLAATLRRHPDVFVARPKELHFFDRTFDNGMEWYAEQFPATSQAAIGEATPVYLYDPDARRRIATSLPGIKVLVMLRDPVKRAYSHFWHSRRLGFEPVESFEEALALEPERLRSDVRSDRHRFSYVDRGHYLDQIRAFEASHGPDRVRVTLLEELTGDRVATLEALFTFLGVDPAPAARIETAWVNRYRVKDATDGSLTVAKYPPMAEETRERLAELFRPGNEKLAAHLGRDLSHWDGR